MAPDRIIVSIADGVVQEIFSSIPGIEVVVVNWMLKDFDARGVEFVEVRNRHGQPQRCIVTCRATQPLLHVASTEIAAALYEAGVPSESERRLMGHDPGLYVLFDRDRGELTTTEVFCSYSEAAEEIDDRQHNVTVARLLA